MRWISWIFLSFRGLWSASGGDGAVRATLWGALGSSGGGAVCDLHPGAWPAWGGLVSPLGAGQSGQRAAGGFWCRGETVVWQVQFLSSFNHTFSLKGFLRKSVCVVCVVCSSTDVHTVASLLKLYLRQLPEPLVPYRRYQEFLLCGQKLSTDRTLVTAAVYTSQSEESCLLILPSWLLSSYCPSLLPLSGFGAVEKSSSWVASCKLQPTQFYLPVSPTDSLFPGFHLRRIECRSCFLKRGKVNFSTLTCRNLEFLNVCRFLNEVQSYASINKMSCQNLATVFGPNILRAKAEDPQSIMGGKSMLTLNLVSSVWREPGRTFFKE